MYYASLTRTARRRGANVRSQDNHYVVFCPDYWTFWTPPLSEVISEVDRGLKDSHILGTFYGNQAQFYFHESMVRASARVIIWHTQNLLLAPRQLDYRFWTPG